MSNINHKHMENRKNTNKFTLSKAVKEGIPKYAHCEKALEMLILKHPEFSSFISLKQFPGKGKTISITLQDGPVKQSGINGMQVDQLVEFTGYLVQSLNDAYPCDENQDALNALKDCLDAFKARTKNRKKRNVEGTNAK